MKQNLTNFIIKYCLGYVNITRRNSLNQRDGVVLKKPTYFNLNKLLSKGGGEDNSGEIINLKTFYSKKDTNFDAVSEDEKTKFDCEKSVAQKIDSIYNKYRNNSFTQQVSLRFGNFKIEKPVDTESEEDEQQMETVEHSLFVLPIRIEKEYNKQGGVTEYYIHSIDPDIQMNVGYFESILGENEYLDILREIGKYENKGLFSLPMEDLEVFNNIWGYIKSQLKLEESVKFDENSFFIEENIKIVLGPKSNYFLAKDLKELAEKKEEDLAKTALSSWTSDDNLDVEEGECVEGSLYFPFLYDKFQLSTLTILGNKASIIQGPPGTGKSETISNILCHLVAKNKKILFVSQKSQALKVVKDKLNTLNIEYLYGYLPNPASQQIGEEDERDGIAERLNALDGYIERPPSHRREKKLEKIIEERNSNREDFNNEVERQRKIYKLHIELSELEHYKIEVTNFNHFRRNFSSDKWKEIKKIKKKIKSLEAKIEEHKKKDEADFEDVFLSLDLKETAECCEAIGKLLDDFRETGYDRRNKIVRWCNNFNRNTFRLNEEREKIPRDIIEYIDNTLSEDISRSEAVKFLEHLYSQCKYYENQQSLEKNKKNLHEKLKLCGISESEFSLIDSRIEGTNPVEVEDVKNKIVRTQKVKNELKKLNKQLLNGLKSSEFERERKERISLYIRNIIDKNIKAKLQEGGVQIRQVIEKLKKALRKSKKAFKTFDNLRNDGSNFKSILKLIPIWIMELDDASRIVPLESNIFDYVILDESSQCNFAYTLPTMYRAKKVLFVGDSEQMRDDSTVFKSNRIFDELAQRYKIPEEVRIKETGSATQSVLDIAIQRGFKSKPLRNHYRSPAELIGFSNKYFYKPKNSELIPLNSEYLTYKDTNRIMLIHKVTPDLSEEIDDKVNVTEAKKILELFKELRSDEHSKDKSIGILSFFNEQATYIRKIFEKEGYQSEKDNFKIGTVEGIQGDEKDIIIYSFVIRNKEQKNKYAPLTGERGDIRAEINKGRVNVAFSRAKLQSHCFVSMPPNDIPDGIWIKKYLEYVQGHGEVSFNSHDIRGFDSNFEKEFYQFISPQLKDGFMIQNQVQSCGFKIDFVITNTRTSKRIAVECDGPCHFKDEIDEAQDIYIESDEERQRILESAKWDFYRIKYSNWIKESFDKESIVSDIKQLLENN